MKRETVASYLGVSEQRADEIKAMIVEKILAHKTLKDIIDEAMKYEDNERMYAMFKAGEIVKFCDMLMKMGKSKLVEEILKCCLKVLRRRREREADR